MQNKSTFLGTIQNVTGTTVSVTLANEEQVYDLLNVKNNSKKTSMSADCSYELLWAGIIFLRRPLNGKCLISVFFAGRLRAPPENKKPLSKTKRLLSVRPPGLEPGTKRL